MADDESKRTTEQAHEAIEAVGDALDSFNAILRAIHEAIDTFNDSMDDADN